MTAVIILLFAIFFMLCMILIVLHTCLQNLFYLCKLLDKWKEKRSE